ncbi:hypothetical protein FRC08_003349 [Ceratobasidium sp. 394]|nr:hypothetical protein FRC08_003349 [Ceratobasidium sp. 394]
MSHVEACSDDHAAIPPERLERLDPEYRDFVLAQPAASRTPLYTLKWSPQLREMVNSSTAGKAKAVPVGATETVDLGDFSVRIVLPDGEPPKDGWPALIYLHGGGWLFGTSQTGESFYTRVCMEARCVVMSVDYRLAPEHTFPTALNDTWSAFLWICGEGGAKYRINKDLIAVCGYSSGGNLAAVIAQRATMSCPPIRLCAQILLMPLLDLTPTSDPSTWSQSMREYANVFGLYARDLLWSRDLHTPEPSDRVLPDASPLLQERAEAFEGLPRTWISVAEMDVLRSAGELYAMKLKEHGVPVELKTYSGAAHLLIQADEVCELARTMRKDQIEALNLAFTG